MLWTSADFASDRNETQILFALLDTNEDGAVSLTEIEDVDSIFDRSDLNSDNRVDLIELHSRLKPRSSRRKSTSIKLGWQTWDANRSEHVEDLSVNVAFRETERKSKLLLDDCTLVDPWKTQAAELQGIDGQEASGQALLLSHPKVSVALTAEEQTKDSGQISVGVLAEGNALFRYLDRNGNWNLSRTEINDCRDRILELDVNGDQQVDVDELPILLRVCIARGVVCLLYTSPSPRDRG